MQDTLTSTPFDTRLYHQHNKCRICGTFLSLSPFLNLGSQPFANNLHPQPGLAAPIAPLELTRCPKCGLVQLTVIVDPEELFANYLYTPSQSKTFHKHFEELALFVTDLWATLGRHPGYWLDIGSNDGLLLSKAQGLGWDVFGIEPAVTLAKKAVEDGIDTLSAYWGMDTARMLGTTRLADVITATNVFAHCDDVRGFLSAAKLILADDGILIIEVPDLKVMIESGTYDLVYHEHLSYFDESSMMALMAESDLEATIELVPIHGGSLRVIARKGKPRSIPAPTPYKLGSFARDVERKSRALAQEVRAHSKVAGFGAPAKATVMISYAGFTSEDILYLVDDSPLKQGKYLPGSDIPILPALHMQAEQPDLVVVFPWNVASDIIPKIQRLAPDAKILIPQPEVRYGVP